MLELTKTDIKNIAHFLRNLPSKWYPQLDFIEDESKPLVFYSTGEDYSNKEVKNGWPVPVYRPPKYFYDRLQRDRDRIYGSDNVSVNKIFEHAHKVFEKAIPQIEKLSSFFILIEGEFDYTDLGTQVVYNHYHPSRGDNDFCRISTYSTLAQQVEEVREDFHYADFYKAGINPPKLYNMEPKKQADIIVDYCNRPELQWQSYPMPRSVDKTLRIDFDGHRYAHSVTPLTKNIWVICVFNDVFFKQQFELPAGGVRFTDVKVYE